MAKEHVAPLGFRLLFGLIGAGIAAFGLFCVGFSFMTEEYGPSFGVFIPLLTGAALNSARKYSTSKGRIPYWLGVPWMLSVLIGGVIGFTQVSLPPA